jgi:hypothetical protein
LGRLVLLKQEILISFGQHGSGTYFGEAVIVSIASSLQCTIASTEALSGETIAGVEFTVSEKPVYTLGDPTFYNIKRDSAPTYQYFRQLELQIKLQVGSDTVGTDISEIILANDLEMVTIL